ncbi:hypothetical protein GWI33_023223 [Rhynchophorus ferrugineus]|uniref:Uncharacterized protein n=1 Tax=Rhynchophorus ferrugineus TaxID=354439 RepID=A0A834LY18_RHYFE|nr:hypothetical protein GWI33_023224 [Rhynchophorus ferrugineus]KAF7264431.1 hypothetical protein GWI33_023223 [Rhynchophorus ferrugineus]
MIWLNDAFSCLTKYSNTHPDFFGVHPDWALYDKIVKEADVHSNFKALLSPPKARGLARKKAREKKRRKSGTGVQVGKIFLGQKALPLPKPHR